MRVLLLWLFSEIVGLVSTNILQIVILIWKFQGLFILAINFCPEAKDLGTKKWPNLAKMGQNGSLSYISRWGWFIPHCNQNRQVSIVIFSYWIHMSNRIGQNWPKWPKWVISLSSEPLIGKSWLTPHSNQNEQVNINIVN